MILNLLTGVLRRGPWLSIAFVATMWPACVQAGSLKEVWELDLKKALQGENLGPHQSLKVYAVQFSPDGQQIAVHLADTVVLFRVQDPKTVLMRFQREFYGGFGWSPDSRVIHSSGHVIQLSDSRTCELSNVIFPQFISNNSLIALSFDANPLLPNGKVDSSWPRAAHLRFYDADCQEQDSWEVSPGWLISDASPDRGLLLVWEIDHLLPYGHTELIVSPFTKRVIRSRSVTRGPVGWFADRGRALCGGNICWDVDTAKQIGGGRSQEQPLRLPPVAVVLS